MKRYKPKIDKYFYIIWIPLTIVLIASTILTIGYLIAFILLLLTDIFSYYFMISSLIGYVELKEETIYIKFGFILKREIPYKKIIDIKKERRFITYSMLAIKNAFEHVNIKYNRYDMITVSVKNNDEFINDLKEKINKSKM